MAGGPVRRDARRTAAVHRRDHAVRQGCTQDGYPGRVPMYSDYRPRTMGTWVLGTSDLVLGTSDLVLGTSGPRLTELMFQITSI